MSKKRIDVESSKKPVEQGDKKVTKQPSLKNMLKNMKVLDCSGQLLKKNHFMVLIKHLKENRTVTSINLSGQDISGNNIAGELSEVIKQRKSLIELNLDYCTLSVPDLKLITEGLKTRNDIKVLRLSYWGSDARRAKGSKKDNSAICKNLKEIVKNNVHMEVLTISNYMIQYDKLFSLVCDIVAMNHKALKTLECQNWFMRATDKDIDTLKSHLKENVTLIDLGMNERKSMKIKEPKIKMSDGDLSINNTCKWQRDVKDLLERNKNVSAQKNNVTNAKINSRNPKKQHIEIVIDQSVHKSATIINNNPNAEVTGKKQASLPTKTASVRNKDKEKRPISKSSPHQAHKPKPQQEKETLHKRDDDLEERIARLEKELDEKQEAATALEEKLKLTISYLLEQKKSMEALQGKYAELEKVNAAQQDRIDKLTKQQEDLQNIQTQQADVMNKLQQQQENNMKHLERQMCRVLKVTFPQNFDNNRTVSGKQLSFRNRHAESQNFLNR